MASEDVSSDSLLGMDEPQLKRRRLSSDDTENDSDAVLELEEIPAKLHTRKESAEDDQVPDTGQPNAIKEPEERTEASADEKQDHQSDSQEEADADTEEEEPVIAAPVKAKPAKKKKKSIHRKEIRKIMTVDQLDEETLAAQKEEAERLQRIAEKQQHLRQQASSAAPLMAVSFEDAIKGIADNGMNLSLSDLYDDLEIPSVTPEPEREARRSLDKVDDDDKQKHEHERETLAPAEVQVEPEVYTLSSDDDEPENLNPTAEEGPHTKIEYNFCKTKTSGGVVYSGNSTNVITLDDEEPQLAECERPTEPVAAKDFSDDDDCMVISPPPSDQEEDKDEEANNVPDEFGRVLVNMGHPEGDPDIFLPPRIAEAMKPHQIGGVRFLYDNLVESLERFENSLGFGCIVAHSMGLGKTIQAAAFCEIFIRCTSARTVLVIVPINTIQNWSHEFNHWLPTEVNSSTLNGNGGKRKVRPKLEIGDQATEEGSSLDSASTDQTTGDECKPKRLNLFVLNETIKTLESREKIISEWGREGGVLLIGYEMYRMLALRKLKKSTKKKKAQAYAVDQGLVLDLTGEQDDLLLDRIHRSLVRPGPDLVICDEGHRIKNSGASISQALKAIRTRRRVVLTGYPLQNNLMEYWCMVDFIRPNYLGTKAEFSNMFERPISNGQCADSTPGDRRLMQFRSHVLHSLLQGFVQRKSHAVLKRALPPKQEFVFLVKMSSIQFRLYKEYINYIQQQVNMGQSTPNPIKAFAVCSKLWNHADVLYRVMKKKQSVLLDDLDLEDLALADEVKKLKKTTKSAAAALSVSLDNSSPSNGDSLYNGRECIFTGAGAGAPTGDNPRGKDKQSQDSLISLEWATSCFQDYIPGVLENGTKFELLFIIIEQTLAVGDKLLVFSQSLLTLDLMETFLHAKYEWKKGQHYFRLDGSTQGLERERLINDFNDSAHSASVFLVSTRAGSLGVNLIGANRVVVFDASWNPCHDCQAVCRIYRYGQTKPCQIYRFVTDYTLEKQIYDRQIHKGGMANRVVDEMNPDSHFNSRELLSTLLLEIRDLERSQGVTIEHDVDKYSDPVIQTLLTKSGDKITRKPFEHESLLIDRKEKKLSAAERRLALRNYEIEKKAAANYTNGGVGRGPIHTSGGGIVYPARSNETSGSSWNSTYATSSSSSYSNYSLGGGRPVASIRPYQRGIYDQGSVAMVPNTKPPGSALNWPAVIEDLRRRGVLTTQVIKLRRNYVMPNPTGGADIYLRPGDKLELIRARKCSYIRLMSGQFMAMRKGSRGFTFLDTIPFSQQLNTEQLGIFLSSFLREIPAEYAAQNLYQSPLTYHGQGANMSSSPSRHNGGSPSSSRYNYGRGQPDHDPPSSFPLPPSLPYGSYSSSQNVRLTNQLLNSGGGGVRIWLKDHLASTSAARRSASTSLVPDMELIKIGSGGAGGGGSSSRSTQDYRPEQAHHHAGGSYFPNPRFPGDQISIGSSGRNSVNSQSISPAAYSRPFPGQSSRGSGSEFTNGGSYPSGTQFEESNMSRFVSQNRSASMDNVLHPSARPPLDPANIDTDTDAQYYQHRNDSSELQVLKIGGSGAGSSSGMSNGYSRDHERRENFRYSDTDFDGVPAIATHSLNRHQHQYYDAVAAATADDSDLPLSVYPISSHKVPDADRFKYS